jgi:hypothetical protein
MDGEGNERVRKKMVGEMSEISDEKGNLNFFMEGHRSLNWASVAGPVG